MSVLAIPLLLAALVGPAGDSLCAAHTTLADPSLYCLPLLSTDRAPSAQGTAVLQPMSSPFGLAVTRDGRAKLQVLITLSGLPDPQSLGPYRAFVAWATTPELDPMIRLGSVHNGRTLAGFIDLERFLIMVSAEASPTANTRSGPLVLRGSSPSLMMAPHGVTQLPPQPGTGHDHESSGWTMPRMHPQVSRMPFGLERFRPGVAPFLPAYGGQSLPRATESRAYQVADGDTITLTAGKVSRLLRSGSVVMYAYEGQIPGPRLELTEGSTVTVRFRNQTDLPSSIHWHGLRLDNASDGVPGLTQPPVPPGGEFVYRVHAPDGGLFWYHPHQRTDVAQDLGLAGNIVVRPGTGGPAGGREAFLMLDDLLIGNSGLVPYGREAATHALMGRFGNMLLVNGAENWSLQARPGETVRLQLTNAASARTFNLSIDNAELQVLGSDAGTYGTPRPAASAVIAPSERYLVEATFARPGRYALMNRVRGIDRMTGRFFAEVDTLGVVTVEGKSKPRPAAAPRTQSDSLVRLTRAFRDVPPDRVILLTLRTRNLPFALVQALRLDTAFVQPVEWTSTMPMMDWLSTAGQVAWSLRDSASGAEGMDVDWRVPRAKPLVVRLVNDKHVLHPMGHPIHLHGQRFLVLARNGVPNADPVWKDTVLVPAGGTVDLLVDTGNPGRWMLHCHIAEHLESGMHTLLTVE
jgi:suppressor of ftsI